MDPSLKLFFPLRIGPGRKLPGFVHFLYILPLLFLSVVQSFLSHSDQMHELIIFHYVLQLLCCELLEGITFEQALAGLTLTGVCLCDWDMWLLLCDIEKLFTVSRDSCIRVLVAVDRFNPLFK